MKRILVSIAKNRNTIHNMVFILLFTSGCSTGFSLVKRFQVIDPEIKPYIQEFQYMSLKTVSDEDLKGLTAGFYDIDDGNAVGLCNYWTKEITIKTSWWNNASYLERFEVLFHEGGHCLLERQHTSTKDDFWHDMLFHLGLLVDKESLDDGCPASMMHPFAIGSYCMEKHYNYYVEELFLRTSKEKYDLRLWEIKDGNLEISR